MPQDQQARLMEGNEESYVTYASEPAARSKSNRVGIALGMCALAVASVALALATTAHVKASNAASQDTQLQTVVKRDEIKSAAAAQTNFKSQFASMMVMNQPACRRSHQGYIACLDLVNSAQQLITDLTDPDVSMETVLDNIRNETYRVGTAFAFATRDDDKIEAMAPVLAEVLKDTANHVTVDGVADLSKCDYVWRGVACLTVLDTGILEDNCDSTKQKCANKVMPIIHILDKDNSDVTRDGKVRRRRRDYGSYVGGVGSSTYMSNGYQMNSNGYLANPSRQAQIDANNAGALTRAEANRMGLPLGGRD